MSENALAPKSARESHGRTTGTRPFPGEATRNKRFDRLACTVALAVVIAITILNVIWAVRDWHLHDMDVYWNAGQMWRNGGNPYLLTASADANSVYRYAPWFAALWVPLTYLPRMAANVLWSGLLVVLAFVAVWPLVKQGGRAAYPLALLMWGVLFGMAAIGNAHGLMVAWMVWGVERRSGPLWIALAASLKVVPILCVLVYAGRRQWGRVAMTIALSVLLVAPMLLFERPPLAAEFGASNSLWSVAPWLWIASSAVALAAVAWVVLRRIDWAWPTIGAASNIILPRLFVYDVTLLLPGLAETVKRMRDRRTAAAGDR